MNLLCVLLVLYFVGFTAAGRLSVKPEECQTADEVYQCGPPCDAQCRYKAGGCARKTSGCVWRCYCQPGFARDDTGLCIPAWQCPVTEAATSVHLLSSSTECDKVRSSGSSGANIGCASRNVEDSSPPPECGRNEEFSQCGSACPATCGGQKPCSRQCVPGCVCIGGFLRGPDGQCIRPSQCPIKCGPNGVFKPCGPPCEETCDTLGRSVQETCPGNYCIAKCYCKPGFVRNSANKCIPPMYCPC